MDTEKLRSKKLFRIETKNSSIKVQGGVVGVGRYLIGRSESCDIIIDKDEVSAIHAVLEITDEKIRIYDMNSTNGTQVGGKKVVVGDLKPGDSFLLSDHAFVFSAYVQQDAFPPVLDSLDPVTGSASVHPSQSQRDSRQLPATPVVPTSDMPYVVYPLAADPRADQTEYIFEDLETLYPIFKYEQSKTAVEVIILFQDRIFSVDYLPDTDGAYHLAGYRPDSRDLEFPYLGKAEKIPLVEIHHGKVSVNKLPGYDILFLSDNQPKSINQGAGSVDLRPQDIIRFSKGPLQIFLRNVDAPPKVASAPLMRRDPVLRKYLFLFLSLIGAFSVGIHFAKFEEKPEEETEKAPERLATILYKQKLVATINRAVESTPKEPPRPQKAPDKVAVAKSPATPTKSVEKPDIKQNKNVGKIDPGVKTATEKKVVKKGDPKQTVPKESSSGSGSPKKSASANQAKTYSRLEGQTKGPVDVYKSADFSSSVSSVLAKGGSLSGVTTTSATVSGQGSGFGSGVATGVGSGGDLKKASVTAGAGSLTGATTGLIGTSKGAEGLSSKRAIFTAGIPAETVVLGSMDPDVIRRILMDNLPKFRFCYQSELERTSSEVQGVIKLNFVIGASGHVTQAGVDQSSSLPTPVKRCVVDVLRGIQFPEPMGGGTVEVKQPMNFYPKKI